MTARPMKQGRRFTGLAPLLALCLFLFACEPKDACIHRYDFNNAPGSETVFVDATKAAPTQLGGTVESTYKAEGEIYLGCEKKQVTVNLCPNKDGTGCDNTPDKLYVKDGQWVPSGITVEDGDVLMFSNISGNWSAKESQGNGCLLSVGGEQEATCLAKEGKGLYITGNPLTAEKDKSFIELTTAAASGQGGDLATSAQIGVAEGMTLPLSFRFMHKEHSSSDKTVPADPSDKKYAYYGGYIVSFNHCKKENRFENGACMTDSKTTLGSSFVIADDKENAACKGDDDYSNNYGGYRVKATFQTTGLAGFLTEIVDAYKDFLFGEDRISGLVGTIYEGLVSQEVFWGVVRAAMTLAIVFIGLAHIAGLGMLNRKAFTLLTIKFGVIIAVTGPDGWDVIHRYVAVYFTDGVDQIIGQMAGVFSGMLEGNSVPSATVRESEHMWDYADIAMTPLTTDTDSWRAVFQVVDNTFSLMFSRNAWAKIGALFTAWPLGTIYAVIIFACIIVFMITVAKAVMQYVLVITSVAMLLNLFPIIAIFWMFKKTGNLFEVWMKFMFTYFLQPIFVFTFVIIFCIMLYVAFYTMLSFTVCFQCVYELDLPFNEIFLFNAVGDFDIICVLRNYSPWGAGTQYDLLNRINNFPVPFYQVGVFVVITYLFYTGVEWVALFATSLGKAVSSGTADQFAPRVFQEILSTPTEAAATTVQLIRQMPTRGKKNLNSIKSAGAYLKRHMPFTGGKDKE
jgi:type IV secretory pathway VirB6-like protein